MEKLCFKNKKGQEIPVKEWLEKIKYVKPDRNDVYSDYIYEKLKL